MKRYALPTLIIALTLVSPIIVIAAVMTSGSYKIESDSVNVSGVRSTSANFAAEDTVGEIATGDASSTAYTMHAGYQQMTSSYIAITDQTPITMSGGFSGITNSVTTGTMSWTVTTDDAAGYSLSIKAASAPAMQAIGGAYFSDYTPAGSAPDYNFTVNNASSTFGFSPEGTDITSLYKDNGASCNTGSSDTADKCWNGFTTVNQIVAQSTGATSPSGTLTTVKLQAQNGSNHIQEGGPYTATITATALAL